MEERLHRRRLRRTQKHTARHARSSGQCLRSHGEHLEVTLKRDTYPIRSAQVFPQRLHRHSRQIQGIHHTPSLSTLLNAACSQMAEPSSATPQAMSCRRHYRHKEISTAAALLKLFFTPRRKSSLCRLWPIFSSATWPNASQLSLTGIFRSGGILRGLGPDCARIDSIHSPVRQHVVQG
ncbi:hypothetical protein D9M71_605380 [compost metagenome]